PAGDQGSAGELGPDDKNDNQQPATRNQKLSFRQRFSIAFNAAYDALVGKYTRGVEFLGVAAFGAGLYFLMSTTPSSFVPSEDMGTIFVNVSLPPASTLERTTAVNTEVDSLIRGIPAPTITGFGQTSGFTFQLQDRGGHSTAEFYKVAQDFLAALNQRPEIQYATTAFNPGFPQYQLAVNVAKVKEAGLTEANILNAMQVYYGGVYSTNFNQFGKQYRVMVQADTSYRASPEGLSKVFVRNASGAMAPITEFVTLTRIYGPESLNRFNLFTAISVNGSPKEGVSSGQSLLAIQEVASQKLPAGYGFEFSGLSREEQKVGGQALYVFALSLIFVYLLLSAQYESYLLPFAVLLSIPIGLCGTYLFAKVMGIDSNIYMQISIIMLIGLLAKNAILIVEFASLRRL
nr:hypothetical protein [Tanacetum cinerariifolium]